MGMLPESNLKDYSDQARQWLLLRVEIDLMYLCAIGFVNELKIPKIR
jgi:hypothetical protein